ncbi:kinase-like protein [Neolentinus lepideus HHB14362 ss-1]|uniref:Kinase-like protein n=1 Tax=Neolentinus lepideus HHB14362 ss-1 TaxID=1314782 RepID=A0A165NQ10_9AGAM|nr:kinase-like protein [Neolentinus lepideus HHB14362 ss-1]
MLDFAIMMLFCDQGDILQYIEQHPHSNKLTLVQQISAGLDYIHHANRVHSNIKPENVLIDNDGIARIMDIGITAALEHGNLQTGVLTLPKDWMYKSDDKLTQLSMDNMVLQGQKQDIYTFAHTIYHTNLPDIYLLPGKGP